MPMGAPAPGYEGPTASWREEDGRQNAIVGMSGRVYDLILVEQPEKLASIAEATLEDAVFESGRPVMMVPKVNGTHLGETIAIAWNGSTETRHDCCPIDAIAEAGQACRGYHGRGPTHAGAGGRPAMNWRAISSDTGSA